MHSKFSALRRDLSLLFPERHHVIDGALSAILAGEHVLLLGPPGTAKSALVRSLAQAFGGTYFERLLTKFSTPEELFGPISLRGLEQDKFARLTSGMLPEAEFAFVDEVFKANSAILNSMLSLMNERIFHNDTVPAQVPLVSLFGASNELPEGRELEALFDRFALRFDVQYLVRPQHMRAVLTAPEPKLTTRLDMKALRSAQSEALKVKITDETVEALVAIRDSARTEGVVVSDRRWKKSLRLVQASAWLAGERDTSPEDLNLLVDALWREPKERNKVAKLVGRLADPVSMQATEILDAARETAGRVTSLKSGDKKAYLAQAAHSLEEFRAQQTKLAKLEKNARPRAKQVITDAVAEVNSLHAELARVVSNGLGLGMRAVK